MSLGAHTEDKSCVELPGHDSDDHKGMHLACQLGKENTITKSGTLIPSPSLVGGIISRSQQMPYLLP